MLFVISAICFSIWLFGIAGGQTFHEMIHLFAALGLLTLILAFYEERPRRPPRNPDPRQQRRSSSLLRFPRK